MSQVTINYGNPNVFEIAKLMSDIQFIKTSIKESDNKSDIKLLNILTAKLDYLMKN